MPEILCKTLTWDQGREMATTPPSPRPPNEMSTSAAHTRRGSAAPTKTPTACYTDTLLWARTVGAPGALPDDVAVELNTDPAKSWASKLRSKLSKNYSQTRPNRSLLHLPRETARWLPELWGFVFCVDVDVEHK